MAGRGPAKSENSIRSLTQKDIVKKTLVTTPAELRGDPLPEGVEWHVRTLVWWETWRGSALTMTFGNTDWEFLLDTAVLHSAFWNGKLSVAAELRLRVAKIGATPEDRLRLRLEVTSPDAGAEISTTTDSSKSRRSTKAADDRRDRLTLMPPIAN
jgi:hypothetical protein